MANPLSKLRKYVDSAPGREYLVRRLLGTLGVRTYRYLLVVQPVPAASRTPPGRQTSIDVRPIGRDDYEVAWFPRPARAIESRFDQGALCWVAFKGERPIGCIWLMPGPYLEDEVRCRFVLRPERQVAWDFDVYVAEDMRLGRAFVLLWDTANAWLREHGFRWSASRIDALNTSSLQSHKRMGAQVVGQVVFLVLGERQLSFGTGGRTYSPSSAHVPDIPVAAPPTGAQTSEDAAAAARQGAG